MAAAAPSAAFPEWLVMGSHVHVSGKYKAVVRFLGRVTFAEGAWVGLELERPVGKHNGTVLGKSYFVTALKHATFVKADALTPYNPITLAATSIQSFHRVCVARRKVGEAAVVASFNKLDADAEMRQLLRQQRLLETPLGRALERSRPSAGMVDVWELEAIADTTLEVGTAPQIKWPLTPHAVLNMARAFRDGKHLSYRDALILVSTFRRYSVMLPTLVEHVVQPGATLTIVGDTHGQLADVLTIFDFQAQPSVTNAYLFNGDFVDRGANGVEVMLLLMAWSLALPGRLEGTRLVGAGMYLQRGNHESHAQNLSNGFMQEVFAKYCTRDVDDAGDRELRLYDAFQAAFDALPLASIVAGSEGAAAPSAPAPRSRIFVVHGGLMHRNDVTLDQIAAVNRARDVPYGLVDLEDRIFENLMWSDPRREKGCAPSDRGAGQVFGPDVTAAFCALNGVTLVVRSHEVVNEGVAFMHDGRLATVFSASRYCGRGTNFGGVIILSSTLEPIVKTWDAPLLQECPVEGDDALSPGSPTPNASRKASVLGLVSGAAAAATQSDAVNRMLIERIVLHKADLFFAFAAADPTHTGFVTRSTWADVMRGVLHLEIPWLRLCGGLADADAEGRINYSIFLERYRIAMRSSDLAWMDALTRRITEKFVAAGTSLEDSFKKFDEDNSGFISLDEFEQGLAKLDVGLSRAQLYEFMRSIDANFDGTVSYLEFCQRFKYTFSVLLDDKKAGKAGAKAAATSPARRSQRDEWTTDALHRIGVALNKGGTDLLASFTSNDTNEDGLLSIDEFGTMLTRLSFNFTRVEVERIFRLADDNNSGAVNLDEVRGGEGEVTECVWGGGGGMRVWMCEDMKV